MTELPQLPPVFRGDMVSYLRDTAIALNYAADYIEALEKKVLEDQQSTGAAQKIVTHQEIIAHIADLWCNGKASLKNISDIIKEVYGLEYTVRELTKLVENNRKTFPERHRGAVRPESIEKNLYKNWG